MIMCIVSLNVASIADTKIFVGLSSDKRRQLTVYSNQIDNDSNNNAMILPVPFPESVEFVNLRNYKNLFEDCQSCFYNASRGVTRNATLSASNYNSEKLKVFHLGSYQVSLAMNLNDLKRVDENVFVLSEGCEETLTKNYKQSHWGFIICKLAKGNEEYHPFGYSHNLLNNDIFIPTKHYHQKNNYKVMNNMSYSSDTIASSPMFQTFKSTLNSVFNSNREDLIADDWSHEIYLYNIPNPRNNLNGVSTTGFERWTGSNKVDLNKIDFDLGSLRFFDKLKIMGAHPNVDLVVPAY